MSWHKGFFQRGARRAPGWLLHGGLAIFLLSLALPAIRLKIFSNENVLLGYEAATIVELITWDLADRSLGQLTGKGPGPGPISQGWLWSVGAMANRLFLGAYVAAILRFHFSATIAAAIGLLCAIVCILPGQLLEIWSDREWVVCFGYFIWCAAHCALLSAEVVAIRSNSPV